MFNTNIYNRAFDSSAVEAVWRKGKIVTGNDPNVFRKDTCGAWIRRSDYGNTNSKYGWEIDHIRPKNKGGSDHIDNLQPLLWQNNRHKGDNYPYWNCLLV